MEKYPLRLLQIETTNRCNANCKFCIHSSLKKFGDMSDKLFLKILNEAKEIKTLEIIIPMMLGEPLLDKKLLTRLRLINKILPKVTIVLFTNCSLLDFQILKGLSKIKNLYMKFSLNGTKETRKKLMGLDDYEHAITMINMYKKYNKPYDILLIKHPEVTEKEIDNFKKNHTNVKIIPYKNWSGDKFEGKRQTNCLRAVGEMSIMYDGRVNLCCMEYGKVIFGDTNNSTIKEIWESKHRQMYCEAHQKGKFLKGVCENCTKG